LSISLASPTGLAIALSANATTVERRVAASSDDAEEYPTAPVNLTRSDLGWIHDSHHQTFGIRWSGVGHHAARARSESNRGPVTTRFRFAPADQVYLAVYDIHGRMVHSSSNGVFDAGEYVNIVDMGGSAPALDLTRLTGPGGTVRRESAWVR
jgi:hypothetical protein